LHTPGQTNLPFSSHPNVTAILMAHYPGEESGHSIVDVLYGDLNPPGRLPYTIARNESDYGAHITTSGLGGKQGWQSNFTEGLLTDYRYFDSLDDSDGISDEVLYPFGYGLSYTTFNISQLAIAPSSSSASDTGSPLDDLFTPHTNVTVCVTNTGNVAGAAVPQLYLIISGPQAVAGASGGSPKRVLRGFEKVPLEVNETKTVTFELLNRDVSFWDVVGQKWELAMGSVGVEVGWSVGDTQVNGAIAMS
jgi:beta-glucosidase